MMCKDCTTVMHCSNRIKTRDWEITGVWINLDKYNKLQCTSLTHMKLHYFIKTFSFYYRITQNNLSVKVYWSVFCYICTVANTLFPSVNIPSFLKQTVFLSTLILKQKWIWDFIFTTIFTDKLEQNKFGKGFKTKDLTRKLIKSKYMQTQFAKFCELILTKCTTLPLWLLWRLKLEMEKKRGLTQLNWFN